MGKRGDIIATIKRMKAREHGGLSSHHGIYDPCEAEARHIVERIAARRPGG